MHNDNKVDEETDLPKMILDYNATKAAVDRDDQLRCNYSMQKRTKRWPLELLQLPQYRQNQQHGDLLSKTFTR